MQSSPLSVFETGHTRKRETLKTPGYECLLNRQILFTAKIPKWAGMWAPEAPSQRKGNLPRISRSADRCPITSAALLTAHTKPAPPFPKSVNRSSPGGTHTWQPGGGAGEGAP